MTNARHVHPTHAWHELVGKNIMMYVIRNWKEIVPKRSLIYWLSIINRIERYEVKVEEIAPLKEDQRLASSLMERDFPLIFNLITTHLLVHEAESLQWFGPVHSRWMYCFERLNSLITHKLPCISGNQYNQLEMLLIDSGNGSSNIYATEKTRKRKLEGVLNDFQEKVITEYLQVDSIRNNHVSKLNKYVLK